MWKTPNGNRYLTSAEAALFKAATLGLVEQVKDEAYLETCGYGVQVFDQLTWSQRLASLEIAATHLLCDSTPSPILNAVNEATIAAIFAHASFEIDMEIDAIPSRYHWRQLTLRAGCECFNIDDDPKSLELEYDFPQGIEDERRQLWHPLVNSLADQILWDRDFELMETFIDEPPEKATMMRQIMGIDDNYFSTAADDLYSPQQVQLSLGRLTEVLGSAYDLRN